MSQATKMLVLHVAVPGIWADDLQALADEFCDGDLGFMLTEDHLREQVGITVVTIPAEGELNSDSMVCSYDARIVGAHTVDRGTPSNGGSPRA